MPADNSDKSSAKKGENSGAFLRVRVASLVAFIFVALAAVGMAYIGGVMSGRKMCEIPPAHAGQPTESPGAPPGLDNEKNGNILSAEELEFARVLRNQKTTPLEKKAPEEVKVAESDAGVKAEEVVAQDSPASAAPLPPEGGQQGEIFDYVFQIGAFKDELSADRLRQQLEGEGLRTRLARNGKLYLVRVVLRGSPERAAEVREIASRLKLGDPLEISRKAVGP